MAKNESGKYREICAIASKTENGKTYIKNDVIRENVNLTDSEAKHLNSNPFLTGCRYEPMAKAVPVKDDKDPESKDEPVKQTPGRKPKS